MSQVGDRRGFKTELGERKPPRSRAGASVYFQGVRPRHRSEQQASEFPFGTLARALVARPARCSLDEPFADPALR